MRSVWPFAIWHWNFGVFAFSTHQTFSFFYKWGEILKAGMATNICLTLVFPALPKVLCTSIVPGISRPVHASSVKPYGLWAFPCPVCTHRISTVSTPPWTAGPLRCSTRIFTMYNAHIPKAWRPFRDFHTYSLADILASFSSHVLAPDFPPVKAH